MSEINLKNVHTSIVGSTVTTEGGDVLVNGQKITNYFYSAQYQDLKKQWDELQKEFAKTKQRIERYPDEEEFKTDLLKIDTKRNEVQNKIDDLKREVIRLAETFTKIPINTERLRLAKQHFEEGDYPAARAILDAEQMGTELDALLEQQDRLQQQQAENQDKLIFKSYEFLILADLTAIDFTLPDRFDKTVEYFERSLKAAHTQVNTFAYAYFLQQHNQFNAASPWYEEALGIYRTLAEANPQTHIADVALTLNNLAVVQEAKHQFPDAEKAYEEALGIYRILAETNPQTYLPDVSMTLNNLAILRATQNQYPEAETAYKEALKIRRLLAKTNPQSYQPKVAMTLSNLAALHEAKHQLLEAKAGYEEAMGIYRSLAETSPQTFLPNLAFMLHNLGFWHHDKNQFPEAEAAYEEALGIYRTLAEVNSQTYQPNIAWTLYNLANLRKDMNQFPKAESSYEEALSIYRSLAQTNPETYLPNVAMIAAKMSTYYLQVLPDQEKSLAYALETLRAAWPLVKSVPSVIDEVNKALQVAEEWGQNTESFFVETIRAVQGGEEKE